MWWPRFVCSCRPENRTLRALLQWVQPQDVRDQVLVPHRQVCSCQVPDPTAHLGLMRNSFGFNYRACLVDWNLWNTLKKKKSKHAPSSPLGWLNCIQARSIEHLIVFESKTNTYLTQVCPTGMHSATCAFHHQLTIHMTPSSDLGHF